MKTLIILLCIILTACDSAPKRYDPIADAALVYSSQMLAPQYNNSVYGGYGAYNVYGNMPMYQPRVQTTCMTVGHMLQCW